MTCSFSVTMKLCSSSLSQGISLSHCLLLDPWACKNLCFFAEAELFWFFHYGRLIASSLSTFSSCVSDSSSMTHGLSKNCMQFSSFFVSFLDMSFRFCWYPSGYMMFWLYNSSLSNVSVGWHLLFCSFHRFLK